MPRPTKCRKVCHFPQVLEFLPSQAGEQKAPVILTVDEYEAIRLIDKEGLSQEQCCEFMQIARTTVQRIYESARKKLAAVLVDGLASVLSTSVTVPSAPEGVSAPAFR